MKTSTICRLSDYTLPELNMLREQYGSHQAVANSLGVNLRSLSRHRAELRDSAANNNVPATPVPAVHNNVGDLSDAIAQVAAAMAAQAAATQALMLRISGNQSVVAPAPAPANDTKRPAKAPVAERVVNTPADEAVFDRSTAGRKVAGKSSTKPHHPTDRKDLNEDYVGPLGDGRPYAGAIFGVTKKRRPRVAATPTTQPRTTLVIGDSHFHPAIQPLTERAMMLVSLHAAAIKPEHLVHIGDGGDWSSVCQHVRNDTWKAREKPSIRQDLDSFRENWNVLNRALDEHGVAVNRRHYCMGNHDAWLNTFEDAHPELRGMATGELNDILTGAGWTSSDYGEYHFIGGVAYVHVPLNLMGRPAGGQTAENTIAMQSTRDVVLGHTHRYAVGRRIKFDGTVVTALNAGSSMPEFYVGEYAQLTQAKALDYGVLEVVDFDARIQSHRFVPMRELEARYGAEADRRLA